MVHFFDARCSFKSRSATDKVDSSVDKICASRFCAENNKIAFGGSQGKVLLFDIRNVRRPFVEFQSQSSRRAFLFNFAGKINSLSFNPFRPSVLLIGSSSLVKTRAEGRALQSPLQSPFGAAPVERPTQISAARSSKSLFKSHLAFVNICSGSKLNQLAFDAKIVDALYSTAEEKAIVSFYHLHHSNGVRPQSALCGTKWLSQRLHPISSLAVLSKSTRETHFIGQFAPKAEEESSGLPMETEPENIEAPVTPNPNLRNEGPETENTSLANDPATDEALGSRLSGAQLREYIEKLEKKNPFKEVNTSGMRLSPCGKKVLVGYSDEHLKFWEVFKSSAANKDDLSLALLSEWR